MEMSLGRPSSTRPSPQPNDANPTAEAQRGREPKPIAFVCASSRLWVSANLAADLFDTARPSTWIVWLGCVDRAPEGQPLPCGASPLTSFLPPPPFLPAIE